MLFVIKNDRADFDWLHQLYIALEQFEWVISDGSINPDTGAAQFIEHFWLLLKSLLKYLVQAVMYKALMFGNNALLLHNDAILLRELDFFLGVATL